MASLASARKLLPVPGDALKEDDPAEESVSLSKRNFLNWTMQDMIAQAVSDCLCRRAVESRFSFPWGSCHHHQGKRYLGGGLRVCVCMCVMTLACEGTLFV